MPAIRFFLLPWFMVIGTSLLVVPVSVRAQQEFLLWPNGAPGAKGTAATDKPSIAAFIPTVPNGAAVVIFPGGAYVSLSSQMEGSNPAQWLNKSGVSAFVVKYRLGSNGYLHPIEMWDGQRALRWVKSNAAKYGIDTARIGVLGFSAGGHMASTVSTHYDGGKTTPADSIDRQGCRPAFSLLGYPVTTMDKSFTHMQSRENVIGTNPSQALVDSMSNEKQITAKTPPGFLFHATDDGLVSIKNSRVYLDSLLKHGVAGKLMTFDHGGHGFGMADGQAGAPNDAVLHQWTDSAMKWLDTQGFLKKTVSRVLGKPGSAKGVETALSAIGIKRMEISDALGRSEEYTPQSRLNNPRRFFPVSNGF